MLKQRVITGLSLSVFVLLVLFLTTPLVITSVLMVFFAIAAWEWADLCGIKHHASRLAYALLVCTLALLITYFSGIGSGDVQLMPIRDVLGAGCTWWAVALLWVIYYPGSSIFWRHSAIKMVMGLFVLVPSAVSLIYLSSLEHGHWLFIYVLGIVVMADVGAYIFGRWLGKRKMAPQVSPGKSWAGFWGGFITSLIYAAIVGSQFTVIGMGFVALVVVSGITALASVLGDLLESMLKRERGIKDSSQLLPGHGGFMDRMDSITAAAPVFTLLALLLQASR